MSRTIRTLIPLTIAACAATLPSAAVAAPQDRTTEIRQEVIGSCGGEDDLLVSDFTVRQSSRTLKGGEQLHLHLSGTITRTGTGVVGRYAETQLDKFGDDGSETYSGVLSRLVVPGHGVYRAAGRAVISPDGDFSFTPGLTNLAEGDFESAVCDALG